MKWFLTAIVALTAAGVVESTADTPRKTPASPWNWAGFYVGGHFGYAWALDTTHGGSAGGPPLDITFHFNDVFGGLQAGYNFVVTPKVVFGIEFDVSAADMRSDFLPEAANRLNSSVIRRFGTARGRVGYVVD